MRPSIAFEKNRALVREVVSHYRTTNPRIFGSVLHGTDKEGSDVDILVDALPGATFFDLGGLEDELAATLGVPVQVVTPQELSKYFRAEVLAEAEPI